MGFKSFCKKCFWFFGGCFIIGVVVIAVLIVILELDLPNVNELKHVRLESPLRILTKDNKLIAEFGTVRRVPIKLNQVPKMLINATLATEDQRFYEHAGVDLISLARAGLVLIITGKKEQGGSTITMQVARNFFLTRKKKYIRKIREILLALKIDREFSKNKILELYFNKNFYGSRAYGIAAAAKIYYGETLDQLTLPQIAMLVGLPQAPTALNPLSHPKAALDRRNHVLYRMYDLHYINQQEYQDAIKVPLNATYHDLRVSVTAPYVAEMARQIIVKEFGKEAAYDDGYTVYTTIDSKLQEAANQAITDGLLSYDRRHGYRGADKNIAPLSDDKSQYVDMLKKIPTVSVLMPALVLTVDDQSATALLKDGQTVTLPWSGMSWARKQTLMPNDKERLGRRPKQVSDVLKVGNVIWVIKQSNGSYLLGQLPRAEAALVAMNPKDGSIEALVGGFNYFRSKYNRIIQANRQPGSAFKPFIYSAALNRGYTLATVLNDAPIAISDTGLNELWRPENDTKKFYGPTRLRIALAHSRNLVSVRLLQMIGVPYALNYVTRFGFDKDNLPNSLSLVLGTASVTPLKLTTGYMVFANGGYYVKPYFIDHINNYNNKTIFQAQPKIAGDPIQVQADHSTMIAPRVITPQNAYLMTSALKSVIRIGTGRPARVLHRSDLAGKTGTTDNKHDAWFCGFNSNLVITAWIGFDQTGSLHEYAIRSVLPIWIDFMQQAFKNQPKATMPQPEGIITARIDKTTGLLAPPGDTKAMFEIFRQQYVPKRQGENNTARKNNEEANLSELY